VVVGADVKAADIVTPADQDVWFFLFRRPCWARDECQTDNDYGE
jgi:hypothetical protein